MARRTEAEAAVAGRQNARPDGEAPATAAVEVVYATAARVAVASVPFAPGLTAGEAVRRSGLLERAGVDAAAPILGVYGAAVREDHVLEPGDRVEICRPLVADPRSRRREVAARGGVMIGKKAPD